MFIVNVYTQITRISIEMNKKQKSIQHLKEHSEWDRRGFLKILGIAGMGSISLGGGTVSVLESQLLSNSLNSSVSDRILVLVRLKGGNDGLNTIIPVDQYDTYITKRPTLHIKKNDLVTLTDKLSMPKSLEKLKHFWNDGSMKVVQGVGYSDQNLSHFTSSDIWASASDEKSNMSSGWLGRFYDEKYFDHLINPPKKPIAIQIGSVSNKIFKGKDVNHAFAVASQKRLEKVAERGEYYSTDELPDCTLGEQIQYLRRVSNTTYAYAGVINDAYNNSNDYNGYTDSTLDNQLRLISRLIKGDLGSKIYMVTLGGFDTHGNQTDTHQELLQQLSSSLKIFYDDLNYEGIDNRVLTMTISEFGRTVHENGSNGTDHGTSAPVLLFGPPLLGSGIVGNHPSLSELDRLGNLSYNIDFRSVYQTILTDWLCGDKNFIDKAMLGDDYDILGLGFSCSDKETIDIDSLINYHYPIYSNSKNNVDLKLRIKQSYTLQIDVFDILGRHIDVVHKGVLQRGEHTFSISTNRFKVRLSAGQYFYRINIPGGDILSASFFVK